MTERKQSFLLVFFTMLFLAIGFGLQYFVEVEIEQGTENSGSKFIDSKIERTVKVFAQLEGSQNQGGLRSDIFIQPGAHFKFHMSPNDVKRQKRIREHSKGMWWSDATFEINGKEISQATLKVRGYSTLESDKKSLIVNSLKQIPLRSDVLVNKFLLLNLLYDPHYFEMVFSYNLLTEIGLFGGAYQFVNVSLNDEDMGIYLLMEPPLNIIRRTNSNISSIVRRRTWGGEDDYTTEYRYPQLLDRKAYQQLNQIDKWNPSVQELEATLDIDQYLTLLAFNTLIKNGDSGDEVFFYETRDDIDQIGKLHVLAWDYDDIMIDPTHPKYVLDDPLLYASESNLDLFIQKTPELYQRFKQRLNKLLKQEFTKERITQEVDSVLKVVKNLDYSSSDYTQVKRNEIVKEMEQFKIKLLARHDELVGILDQ